MPRHQRIISETAIYHIVLRGNEKKDIFLDEQDFKFFIELLYDKTKQENAELFAYCLMDNHVHILLRKEDNLSKLMKRINVTYANYFNKKYSRVGHLFQDRFYSENIESNEHLLDAIRYIHNNPLKAGVVSKIEDYPWSSYNCYINSKYHNNAIKFILGMFSKNIDKAIEQFEKFSINNSTYKYFDDEDNNDYKIKKEMDAKNEYDNRIKKFVNSKDDTCNSGEISQIINDISKKYNLSIRQIAKITGLNRGRIQRMLKKIED